MIILGIESSCDETAVAIVQDHPIAQQRILSHLVLSQLEEHKQFGGVVPEIAARSHIAHLRPIIVATCKEANLRLSDVDAIAATSGPGLVGGLIVGLMMAKGIASAVNKPFIAINHLEGHALTCRLTNDVEFPYLLLLVSGGHCQLLEALGVGQYKLLGSTLDDAVGEAFDKVAKMLGMGYPGGPLVESKATLGDPLRYSFPRPLYGQAGCNFSFSGLKTAVRKLIAEVELNEQVVADICASFQYTIATTLVNRLNNATKIVNSKRLVIAGGVAANRFIYENIFRAMRKQGWEVITPPLKLCTDNAAMIAWAGVENLRLGNTSTLSSAPRSRWPLENIKI
jgi:N6-L-threonylcarbamoyladenine synthase